MGTYLFDKLGWYDFERLYQALAKAAYGASVEAWGGSGDWGRDAYSTGSLRYPDPSVEDEGPFVFQVKFVSGANAAGADPSAAVMSAVRKERERIKGRIKSGEWKNPRWYTFVTNAPMDPDLRRRVTNTLQKVLPGTAIITNGEPDVAALLDNFPGIRTSYPQILGIQDLSTLVKAASSSDISTRSAIALREATKLSRVFVPTRAYYAAMKVLTKHNFVVLAGPPEMGKTAIARMIALGRAAFEWDVFECTHPDHFFKTYDGSRAQVFTADDAFGSTEYRPDLGTAWSTDLARILASADQLHWVVFTTRPAPLKRAIAELNLQGSARSFPRPSEIQVNSDELSIEEKAQMLYRHAKEASPSLREIEIVKDHASMVVRSPNFTPLRIERFVLEDLPRVASAPRKDSAQLLSDAVRRGIEEPTTAMFTSFAALDSEEKALLFAMLNEGSGPLALDVLRSFLESYAGQRLTTSVHKLAEALEDHFVRFSDDYEEPMLDWVHPTVRDVVIAYLMDREGERLRFLSMASTSGLMLALSTAGGREGRLSFPFADSDRDWETIQDRLTDLLSTDDDDGAVALMTTLISALRTPDLKAERKERLIQCGVTLVSKVGEAWTTRQRVRRYGDLDAYYQLSILAGVMVPCPNLQKTWEFRVTRAKEDLGKGLYDGSGFDAWTDFVFLMRRYDPRFLQIASSVEEQREMATAFLDSVSERLDELEYLDPTAETDVQIADTWSIAPEEPASEEEEERRWLDVIIANLEVISNLAPKEEARADSLMSTADDHRQTRIERQERWEGYTEWEPDPSDYVVSRPASFDIDALFSDL